MELTGRVFSSSLFICLHFCSLKHLAQSDVHACGSAVHVQPACSHSEPAAVHVKQQVPVCCVKLDSSEEVTKSYTNTF